MDAQQLATVILTMLPKVSVPLTPDNINAGIALYDTLGKMSRGALILVDIEPVPAKD